MIPSVDAVQNVQAVLPIDDDCPDLQIGNHSSSPNRRHLTFRLCLLLCDDLILFCDKTCLLGKSLPDAYRFQVEQVVLSDTVIHASSTARNLSSSAL